jgi:hypothetical protein
MKMKSERDLEIDPPRPRKRRAAQRAPFQFGEVIQPDRDLIGGYREECGRQQLCINRDELTRIIQHGENAGASTWKMGRWVCRRSQPRDVHRVVSTKFGWRVQRRPTHYHAWHVLGHSFAEIPVLFPSPDVAIAAAEIMIGDGATLEFGYLTWLKP